ncbi:MAG TPA: murein L,D-transpeptidase catalytic domain family protein [Bryobacteraceae bacterium]|nr:murein L,D-transpeptidase catalytic domain family protein [Bryobacteraceae bacterium]
MCSKRFLPLALSLYLAIGALHVVAEPPATFPQAQFAALLKLAPGLSPKAIEAALLSLTKLQADGAAVRGDVLAVIDYTKPSTERRFWVFDLIHCRVLFRELAAHGQNSGDQMAVRFSNAPDSLMSTIGALLTGDTYIGKHGLSLRLEGLEKGINDNCLARAIVIHGAAYVNEKLARAKGRIGRSWGCPAVRPEVSRSLIETLRGGALVLAYYPDQSWLRNSRLVGSW